MKRENLLRYIHKIIKMQQKKLSVNFTLTCTRISHNYGKYCKLNSD